MANFEPLRQEINSKVYENSSEDISGQDMNDVLLSTVDVIEDVDNESLSRDTTQDNRLTNIETNKQNKSDSVGKKTPEGGEIFNSATSAGAKSHAEGQQTAATGEDAHAEGYASIASGFISHSEGYGTNAKGESSHAEGNLTEADNKASHSEGNRTKAKGELSHAEGNQTVTFGRASHAEGSSTNVVSDETIAKDNDALIADWTAKNFSLAKGEASHVEGKDCLSLAAFTHAEGYSTQAYAGFSHAEGDRCVARGARSHAEGLTTTAKGQASHTEGQNTIAEGEASHAEGNSNFATGFISHAEGHFTKANGTSAHAEGTYGEAIGSYSHAEGLKTLSRGSASHSGGANTEAYNYGSVAIGVFNKPQKGNTEKFSAINDLFEIGNGTAESARGNAFTVTGDGNVRADGTYESPAGDYAEMFEWKDGNKKGEDRVGYIVAIDGEKIVKANGNEHIGVVSAKPSILGDNPMRWAKKYATDEWGRVILEDVEVKYTESEEIPSEERNAMVEAEFNARMAEAEPIAEEGLTEEEITRAKEMQKEQIRMEAENVVPRTREVEKTRIDTVQKLNPNYNPKLDFVPRTDRSEWSAVGMMGKLLVRQDGSLKVGGKCSAKNGVATNDEKGAIYVMKVISKSQALVLIK